MSFLQTTARRMGAVRASPATRLFSTTSPAQLARMTLVGRLGTEPESFTGSSGKEYIKYVVGTDTGPKDNKTTSWFKVTSFATGPVRDYVMGLQKG